MQDVSSQIKLTARSFEALPSDEEHFDPGTIAALGDHRLYRLDRYECIPDAKTEAGKTALLLMGMETKRAVWVMIEKLAEVKL
jgi:hypothetical protein